MSTAQSAGRAIAVTLAAVVAAGSALAGCGDGEDTTGSASADIEQRLMDAGAADGVAANPPPRSSYRCAPKAAPGEFACTVQATKAFTVHFETVRVDGDRLFTSEPRVELDEEAAGL